MPRKSQTSNNPIRLLRLSSNQTLEEFADHAGVHLQAVYLNEMGMYPTILPTVLRHMVHCGVSESEATQSYNEYVSEVRFAFGEQHVPYELGEPSIAVSSIRLFRTTVHISTAFGFAKAIAVNPTLIRQVEYGRVESFPGQLNLALRDIQLPPEDIEELEYRHQEFYHRDFRVRPRG